MSDSLDTTVFFEDNGSSYGISHPGRVRESNQDQYLIAQLNKSMLVSSTSLEMDQRLFGNVQAEVLLVADGMGGHAAGERASRIAIGHMVRRLLDSVRWFFEDDAEKRNEKAFIEELRELLRDAHSRILMESARSVDHRGMGTTVTMALLMWPRMYVVHAGDSRCYIVRDGEAEQLTKDHTLAQQMIESGGLRPEDEAHSRWSNVLWNVLGGNANSELIAEVTRVELKKGDAIVLCSDGLHRYADNQRLAELVTQSNTPETACHRLVALANEAGGEDNITVVISKPESGDPQRTTWIDDFETVIPGSQDKL